MSLPSWVQNAVDKGQDLSICLELWKQASAVEREERMARREKEKEEQEMERLKIESDLQNKKLVQQKELED